MTKRHALEDLSLKSNSCYKPAFPTLHAACRFNPPFSLSSHEHAIGNFHDSISLAGLLELNGRLMCSHLFFTPVACIPLSCCCVCDYACESKIIPRFIYLQFTL